MNVSNTDFSNFSETSLSVFAKGVHRGGTDATTVLGTLFDRIRHRNETNPIYITVTEDHARQCADVINDTAPAERTGSLLGVPYAVKDMFCTRGLRTTAGSQVLKDWIPNYDATAIKRLRDQGGILVGKTNMHEFAYGATGENAYYGTVKNPFDSTRMAGGSSGGSAAAVAEGLAAFSLGTDTGGSVRIPASLCGLVGLKPTYGRISNFGVIPYCWTLDHVGVITKSVSDTCTVLKAIAGFDQSDPASVDRPVPDYENAVQDNVQGLTLGIPINYFFNRVDPEIIDAVNLAIDTLRQLGANTTTINMPNMDLARSVSLAVQLPEALSYHRRYLPDKLSLYGHDVRAGLASGQFLLAEHYIKARRMMENYRQKIQHTFQRVDMIVTPTCPIIAPSIGTSLSNVDGFTEPVGNALARFTSFFNLTGHPAISVPAGLHSSGLPIGVQLVSRPFEEDTLLRAAYVLEQGLKGNL